MKHTPNLWLFWAILLLLGHASVLAQTDAALLRDLAEENKKSVEALVLYPAETRLAILEATKYPELLIKMQDMREKTSAAYRTLIEDFPQSTQAVFYDLSRYPGLIEQLVQQKGNSAGLRQALEVLPENKREEALGVATRQAPTLLQISQLDKTTSGAFDRLVKGYSATTQQAFRHLLGLPEVVDLLNEDLRFTILVGETYEDNPAWVIHKMDSLNLAVARSHAEEFENWKTTLENDPEAKAELQAAANEYATAQGYAENDYTGDDLYEDGDYYGYENQDVVVHRHYYAPYPYWYGYPWWEPYPRWHPYPWWWDWGYRFPPRGIVIVYLPSYHFMHWYFGNPHHHNHYNRLSTHFVNHYYGHRHSGTTISMGVREWRERNRTIISEEFLADKSRLAENLKTYGRFETSRAEYNAKNPRKQISETEFLEKNAQKYPSLMRSKEAAKAEIQQGDAIKREKRADWAPSKAPAQAEPVPAPKNPRPPRIEPAPTQKPPTGDKPVVREPAKAPKTAPDEAKEYHRQKWEETRPKSPSPTPKTKSTAPPPKTKTVPQTTKTPKTKGGRN